ncbi:ExbD/TolR family protein [Mucilaginibacter lutimaris]|uniref:ExbD/TolR family protein n=1 Tax=Mucilaginibacter lutimaris TaxID=931629 RepID=A0ABW2ZLU8_9SPHI
MAELNSTPERSGTKTRSKKAALRVDLTAMVDLAFLLITFFMLTTTLSKPRAMQLTMPVGEEPGGQAESRTMTICLGKNNKALYYLGMAAHPIIPATVTDYSGSGLRKAIMETAQKVKKATGKTMLVIIKPAQTSVYGNLVNTLDEMKITDTQQYAVADCTGGYWFA